MQFICVFKTVFLCGYLLQPCHSLSCFPLFIFVPGLEIDALNDAYEETLKALFTAPDRPTAMLVSDDILAVVLEQFCGKLGLRVPKDLSIVSFNNSLFSRITSPQLTTVDVNPYQLGMEAASQTINHIENPNLLATKIIVPHKLIPRESCCPPPEL